MQLWAEHLGLLENVFLDPGSAACAQRVNALAEENWRIYADDKIQVCVWVGGWM